MSYYILDRNNNQVGETQAVFDNDSGLHFIKFGEQLPEPITDIENIKFNKVPEIKQQATQLIANTEWQLQRANERDSLGVELLESETPKAIMSYREAVRRASNRAEAELNKLRSVKTVNAFTW